jgi:septal ring factor EnvC (AmiA/AmiB activator)
MSVEEIRRRIAAKREELAKVDKPIPLARLQEAFLDALEARDEALMDRLDRIEKTLEAQEERRREWEERRDREVTEALEAVRERMGREGPAGWWSRLLRLVRGR